jgi:hypothetical protein
MGNNRHTIKKNSMSYLTFIQNIPILTAIILAKHLCEPAVWQLYRTTVMRAQLQEDDCETVAGLI